MERTGPRRGSTRRPAVAVVATWLALTATASAQTAAGEGAAQAYPETIPEDAAAPPQATLPDAADPLEPDPYDEGLDADAVRRKHASGAVSVGAIGVDGFGAGFAATFGWDLTDLLGLDFSAGVGGKQGRGGGAVGGAYTHFDAILPITFNVCASVPRVCPALDLELSLLPGLGYAWMDGVHAGNVILGFAIASLRKTQDMDVGVRAAVLTYLDIVGSAVEEDASRILAMVNLQLGFVIRWGFTQP